MLERQNRIDPLGLLWGKEWFSPGVPSVWEGQLSAFAPSPALTPSVALFPGSSAAPPSSFYSPLPSPLLYPSPKTPSSSAKEACGWPPAAAVRTALSAAKGALLFFTPLFLPSSAADPSPSVGSRVSVARTLVTTSQSRGIRRKLGWGGLAAAGSVRGAGTRT